MPPGDLHRSRKYFGVADEIDGCAGKNDANAGNALLHASGSRQCRRGAAAPGRRSRAELSPIRSEPEVSATAHARGLAGRSGSPLLETRPRIGNGDVAVAD